jgi:acetyl esterase/lipase
MRKKLLAAAMCAGLSVAVAGAQTAAGLVPTGSAWEDVATWEQVKPVETDNIVFANVPLIKNPSASPNPGTPAGIREPLPNTAPPGTMDLHVDVYQVPSSKPTPVVVQFHGGGWIRGDRPSSYRSFSALMAAGMSVVTVEYRNAKDAPAPAAIQDVRCAMAWVKKNAAKYNFDPNRVVTYGGSAGGHLALMAAYAPASFNPPGCTDQPKVVAVLDFYGASNVVDALGFRGSSNFTHQWMGTQLPLSPEPDLPARGNPADTAATSNVGGNPDGMPAQPRRAAPRWPDPDAKTLELAKSVSPMTYIRPGLPPTFIVNGDSDPTFDPSQSSQLKKALDAAGVPNGQDLVVGGKHGNFSREENEKAMLLCLRFLKANGVIQ